MELMSSLYTLFQLASDSESQTSPYSPRKNPEKIVNDEESRNPYRNQSMPVKTKCDKATQTQPECEIVVCIVRVNPAAAVPVSNPAPEPPTPNEPIVLDITSSDPEPSPPPPPPPPVATATAAAEDGVGDGVGVYVTPEDIEAASLILVEGPSESSEPEEPRRRLVRREIPRRRRHVEAKLARDQGKAYAKGHGLPVKARQLGPVCSCRLRCGERVGPSARQALFEEFWKLGGRVAQWQYLADNITVAPKLRITTDRESKRHHSRFYSFRHEGRQSQVCKVFFLNTLGISAAWVVTINKKMQKHGHITSDARGYRLRKKPARD